MERWPCRKKRRCGEDGRQIAGRDAGPARIHPSAAHPPIPGLRHEKRTVGGLRRRVLEQALSGIARGDRFGQLGLGRVLPGQDVTGGPGEHLPLRDTDQLENRLGNLLRRVDRIQGFDLAPAIIAGALPRCSCTHFVARIGRLVPGAVGRRPLP